MKRRAGVEGAAIRDHAVNGARPAQAFTLRRRMAITLTYDARIPIIPALP
jgi:hypothetical protein